MLPIKVLLDPHDYPNTVFLTGHTRNLLLGIIDIYEKSGALILLPSDQDWFSTECDITVFKQQRKIHGKAYYEKNKFQCIWAK